MLNFNKIKEKVQKIKNYFQIDFSFFIMFFVAGLIGEMRYFLCTIFSLLCHEFCHFFVSKKLGYFPKKIKLNFFGAVLEGEDDFLFKDELKIVLAGPIFNFCIVVFCYLSFWFNPETYDLFYDLLISNLVLLAFNLLPIFPLDLGRFILAFLSLKMTRQKALKITKNFSLVCIIFLFILVLIFGIFSANFSIGFVLVNLMNLLLEKCEDTSYKRQLFVWRKFNLLKKGLIERKIYVDQKLPLYSLFKFIDDSHFVSFVFLDDNLNVSKTLTEIEFYKQIGLI